MQRTQQLMFTIALLGFLTFAGHAKAQNSNLLADTDFAKAASLVANPPADADPIKLLHLSPWKFFEIELPASVSYESGKAVLAGKRVFLHSMAFDVEAGKDYTVQVKGEGTGNISVGLLWWSSYDENTIRAAEPHWSKMSEPETLAGETINLKQTFTAPKDATRAYLRIEVAEVPKREGEEADNIIEPEPTKVTVSNPSVTAK